MRFAERLDRVLQEKESLLCVGLDTVLEKIPAALRGLPQARQRGAFGAGGGCRDGYFWRWAAFCCRWSSGLDRREPWVGPRYPRR